MLKYKRFINGPIDANCYLIWDEESREGAIVDPGYIEENIIKGDIIENNIRIKYILNTHGHWDHILNNGKMKDSFDAEIIISNNDAKNLTDAKLNLSASYNINSIGPKADKVVFEGDLIKLGKSELQVIEVPGHTPGGVIFLYKYFALTGDTLFNGSIGRCDLIGSDKVAMESTIEKLKKILPDNVLILSGHGSKRTTFGEQLSINPFLTGQMKPR